MMLIVVETCRLSRRWSDARRETQFVSAAAGGVFDGVNLLAEGHRPVEELTIGHEFPAIGVAAAIDVDRKQFGVCESAYGRRARGFGPSSGCVEERFAVSRTRPIALL